MNGIETSTATSFALVLSLAVFAAAMVLGGRQAAGFYPPSPFWSAFKKRLGESITFDLKGRSAWSLLWAGKLKFKLSKTKGSGFEWEWGPPVIWRPRWGRITPDDGLVNVGWRVGWLWWIYRYARLAPEPTGYVVTSPVHDHEVDRIDYWPIYASERDAAYVMARSPMEARWRYAHLAYDRDPDGQDWLVGSGSEDLLTDLAQLTVELADPFDGPVATWGKAFAGLDVPATIFTFLKCSECEDVYRSDRPGSCSC